MANKAYTSMLPTASDLEGALFNVSEVNAESDTGYESKKATIEEVGSNIVNDIEWQTDLTETTEKTVSGAINEIAGEVADLKDLEGSASGDIATFVDGSDNPLKALTISIEAQQSGSGDPSPSNVRPLHGWTGANIGVDPKYGGFIEWNQILTNGDFSDGVNGWRTGSSSTIITAADNVLNLYKTVSTSDGAIHSFSGSNNRKYLALIDIQIVEGDLPTIRFNGVDKNVLDISEWQTISHIVNYDSTRANADLLYIRYSNTRTGKCNIRNVHVHDLTQMFGETIADYIYSLEQAKEGAGVAYFRNLFPKDYYEYNTGETSLVSKVNGDEYGLYPISWQTEAGEIYSGTLDVTNGILTVTYVGVDMTTLDYTYLAPLAAQGIFPFTVENRLLTSNDIMSNMLAKSASSNWDDIPDNSIRIIPVSTQNTMRVRISTCTTVEALKTALSGAVLVYPLATPVTYQLTPTEVRSLLGLNNVFADCGAVTELKYIRDLNLCINDIISRLEALEGASSSRSVSLSANLTKSIVSDSDTAEGILEGNTEDTEEETKEEAQNER